MKEELTRYTCDHCSNKITVGKDVYAGTPLADRWVRMYLKVKSIDVQKTKVHFCGEGCATAYLLKRSSQKQSKETK